MNAELSVNPKELKDALKKIRLSDRKFTVGEVAFSFKDGFLELQTQGVSVEIAASGTWPGKARANLFNLRPLLLHPPKENPLIIRFREGHLLFGSYSVPANWEDISPPPALIPMDLSWIELLKLRFEYPEAVLLSAGMGPKIEKAEEELRGAIGMAFSYLRETGITEKDLMELVERKLSEAKKR